jgi:NodT family efflux transporter outer membrane factor (OMF) lipoprotein
MKCRFIPGVVVTAGLLAGCTVGPNYRTPTSTLPAEWNERLPAGEVITGSPTANWWKGFGDPELNSLVGRALLSNPELSVAESRVREARAQRGIVAAALWPTAETTGSYARAKQSANQPLIGGLVPPGTSFKYNEYTVGFDASWELDIFGGARRSVEAADAGIAATVYSRQDVEVTLIAEVALNYVELRGGQQRLAIAALNIKAQQFNVALAEDLFHHGLNSNLDAEEAATVLYQTEADVPAIENAIKVNVHHLGVLLGQPPGALVEELAIEAPIPAARPLVPIGIPSDLLRRRADVRSAERQLAAATAQIGVATAGLFPKFSLTGNGGWESVSTGNLFQAASKVWSIGPTVQWQIIDAGRVRSNINVQKAREEQALATYKKTILASLEDVENALVGYGRDQRRNLLLQKAVKTGQNSLQISQDLYKHGLANFINVVEVERTLYQSQDQLVQSDQAVTKDLIALYKALGGGWEDTEPVRYVSGNYNR